MAGVAGVEGRDGAALGEWAVAALERDFAAVTWPSRSLKLAPHQQVLP